MSTVSVSYLKLRLHSARHYRVNPAFGREEVIEEDPRIRRTQEVLDEMAELERSYYIPTLRAMRAYYGYTFGEVRRDRGTRSPFYAGMVNGCLLIWDGAHSRPYTGNFRYRSDTGLRAELTEVSVVDINLFMNYIRTLANTKGKIEVNSHFKSLFDDDWKCTPAQWEALRDYFTPEEIAEIESKDWILTRTGVDTPTET